MSARPFRYIDLFAGAGGLSEGFSQAGFEPVAHVEIDADACETIRTRQAWLWLQKHGQEQVYNDYLRRRITREQLHSAVPPAARDSVIHAPIAAD